MSGKLGKNSEKTMRLTYTVKEFATTGIFQEEILTLPLPPVSIETDHIVMDQHTVYAYLRRKE